MRLELKTNVHPNVDGSPWGWVQIEGTRIEIAVWSGDSQKKLWNRIIKENPYPKGTTTEQLERYGLDLLSHEQRCENERPRPDEFNDLNGGEAAYIAAYRAWEMVRSCDAPNKPGYYRANND